MQLTQHTDYAFRALIYIGFQPDKLHTVAEIAEFYDISQNHLVKVVHSLAMHGFLDSKRGKHGGLQLGKAAGEINLGDVVRAMETHFNIVECQNPQGKSCRIDTACRLKAVLNDATNAFLTTLDAYTLDDLVSGKRGKRLSELL
jgi:Rrf2 family nitric oxide-sensitive transcriptional repressor